MPWLRQPERARRALRFEGIHIPAIVITAHRARREELLAVELLK